MYVFFFFQAEDGIRDTSVTGVQTCALPISEGRARVHLLARGVRGRWKMGREGRASDLLMMTADAWAPPETLALTVSPYRVNTCSPLVGVKTVNRLEQIMAWAEARSRDF